MHDAYMRFMGKTIWRNVSLPNELVVEIEDKKPTYMSIAEFIRLSARFYMDHYLPSMSTPKEEVSVLE